MLAVGAVALPAQGITLLDRDAAGRAAVAIGDGRPPRIVVSRSRPAPGRRIARRRGARRRPRARWARPAPRPWPSCAGEADVYAHAGGQYEWDSAAPAAVALAAGLHVSGVDGTELEWNKPDPWQPHLLICRPELAGPVVEAVQAADRPTRRADAGVELKVVRYEVDDAASPSSR